MSNTLLLMVYKTVKRLTMYKESDIAYEKGATKKGPYSILDLMIKTGSKIAINISEKI